MHKLDQFTNDDTNDAVINGTTDDAVIEVDEATPVVIDISFNLPKNKAKKFIALSTRHRYL